VRTSVLLLVILNILQNISYWHQIGNCYLDARTAPESPCLLQNPNARYKVQRSLLLSINLCQSDLVDVLMPCSFQIYLSIFPPVPPSVISVSWSYRQSVGLLGRRMNPSQSRYLHRTTQTQNKHTHNKHTCPRGIRTHDHSDRASEDSSRLRPLGYRDRLASERAKTVHALDRSATTTGHLSVIFIYSSISGVVTYTLQDFWLKFCTHLCSVWRAQYFMSIPHSFMWSS
jgi:hypothetical protein